MVSVIFHRDIDGQGSGKFCAEKVASSSKQCDRDQALAILTASDDESIDSFGNDSSLEESRVDSEYDEPCICDADVYFLAQTQVCS